LGLSTAFSLMGDATLYTVLPTQTAAAGIALSSVGVLLGVNRAVRLLLNGPAGLAYDRWPRRWLYVPALFIGALSTALYAASHSFWPLLLGRLVWGLAWSGIWVGGATVILDVTDDDNRGRWTGLYQTWFFLGGALGAFSGGLLTDRLGYTASLWIGAGVTAVGGLAALLFLPETRGSRSEPTAGQRPRSPAARLRGNGGLWVAASLQGVTRFIASGVFAATLGLLVQNWLKSKALAVGVATLTGILSASRAGLSMLAAPLAGALSDRLGERWRIVIGALVLGTASLALLTANAWVTILIGIAGVALVRGSSEAMVTALTGDLVRAEQRGRAIGLIHTASDLGSAIAPPIAYLLLPWLGLKGVYMGCAALYAIELGLVLWFRRQSAADLRSDEVRKSKCCVPTAD
jgi:MFS family permease